MPGISATAIPAGAKVRLCANSATASLRVVCDRCGGNSEDCGITSGIWYAQLLRFGFFGSSYTQYSSEDTSSYYSYYNFRALSGETEVAWVA